MEVEQSGEFIQLVLTTAELRLLRRALERASFIDTPATEQAAIAAFCARALEAIAAKVR